MGIALLARFFCAGLDIQATSPTPQEILSGGHLGYRLFVEAGHVLYGFSQKTISEEMLLSWTVFMQTALGIGSALLGAGISFRLFQNRRLACWTGIALALLPNLIFMEHLIHPASLSVFVLLLSIRLALEFSPKPTILDAILPSLFLLYFLMLLPLEALLHLSPLSIQAFFLEGLPWDPESLIWGLLVLFASLGVSAGLTGQNTMLRTQVLLLGRIVLGLMLLSALLSAGTPWNRVPYEGFFLIFAAYGLCCFKNHFLQMFVHTVEGQVDGKSHPTHQNPQYH